MSKALGKEVKKYKACEERARDQMAAGAPGYAAMSNLEAQKGRMEAKLLFEKGGGVTDKGHDTRIKFNGYMSNENAEAWAIKMHKDAVNLTVHMAGAKPWLTKK
jgi:hypothetical protein